MKPLLNWIFPHPLLTVLLAVVWTLLQNDISAGMVVFGLILGVLIPRLTAVWWPDSPGGFKAGKMIAYVLIVLWDILVANVQVAWIVLTKRNKSMKTAWIVVPDRAAQPRSDHSACGHDHANAGHCVGGYVKHRSRAFGPCPARARPGCGARPDQIPI